MSPSSFTSSSERHGRYLRLLGGLVLVALLAVVGLNLLVDPFWQFRHAHALNRVQAVFDERLQKTNWLRARRGAFDAVLLGSSRTAFIDQRDLEPLRAFNYAVNAKLPHEYVAWLDHFVAENGRPATILLGLDFFGSHAGRIFDTPPPEAYIRRSRDPFHRAATMLSLETTWLSLRSLAASSGLYPLGRAERYDRDNRRHLRGPMPEMARPPRVLRQLKDYQARIYGQTYRYWDELPQILRSLKAGYPDAQFIVFTTPESIELFAMAMREGRLPDFVRWLRDLVEVFGAVWDFNGLNSVTTDPGRYIDAHHFKPEVGRLIADRLLGRAVPEAHADFGRLLTAETLDAHLEALHDQLPRLDPDPIETARRSVAAAGAARGG